MRDFAREMLRDFPFTIGLGSAYLLIGLASGAWLLALAGASGPALAAAAVLWGRRR
jgi:hypothetical protein